MNGQACAVAIVGMSGRFPGAESVARFWKNLCEGVESISQIAPEALDPSARAAERRYDAYVRARSILPEADRFDAAFFGMQPREAELTDPQHRVLLECSWEALEDAGYDPARYAGSIGVVAGCSVSSYFLRHVLRDAASIERFTHDYQAGSFAELIGSGHDFLATRISYKLGLRGPAMTVQSACSTSLVAVVQACQALTLRQADMMLAGAASISFPQQRGYPHLAGGILSSDGRCRTFDDAASGTVFGAGAGVVVLKRFEDAERDGDAIAAVIRGYGITNDGSTKVGYAAPSADGQRTAIAAAHHMAGFEPRSIGFVECHGTATPLGDPIEVAALADAFGAVGQGERFCTLGSVKPNVGHLDVAAGMAGLIKTALVVRTGTIPPTLHFRRANRYIDLEQTPFSINTTLVAWPPDREPRRAGVSAFGIGGTNVHLALEAPTARAARVSREPHAIVVSARTGTALRAACARLSNHVRHEQDVPLADVALTLQSGRREFLYRRAIVATNGEEAAQKLLGATTRIEECDVPREERIAFLFPGQGAQYARMGAGLYARFRAYREAFDHCADLVRADGLDLRSLLYTSAVSREALTPTAIAQPALFCVEYALAHLCEALGIAPVATLGHSVGEYVCATLAGVFALEDALRLVVQRGRIMQSLPSGAMLAVRLPEDDVVPLLDGELSLAAVNAPSLCVIAGPERAVERFAIVASKQGAGTRRLATSHAFHSSMMEPAIEPLTRMIAGMRLRAPAQRYVSCATGTWITPQQATSSEYWARHCRATMRFADGIGTLTASGATALLEVGPGSALAAMARAGTAKQEHCIALSLLSEGADAHGETASVLDAAGRLWTRGAPIAWQETQESGARRTSLPAYPFERVRYWAGDDGDAPEGKDDAIGPDSDEAVCAGSGAADTDVVERVVALLAELTGNSMSDGDHDASFTELGFDSLLLGRFAQQIRARLGVDVAFRRLLDDLGTLRSLCAHITAARTPQSPAPKDVPSANAVQEPLSWRSLRAPSRRQRLEPPTDEQRRHIEQLVAATVAKTPRSKETTQRYRQVLADPRVAAGFRLDWKEMVYPIYCDGAAGSRIWDIDGNEYIDLLNGFGSVFFGHAPPFVTEAVDEQLRRGFAIGPQTALANEAATRFCRITRNERVSFCNTGSEAVMAALRVARAVTGRSVIVAFEGSYHGQFDEVLGRREGGTSQTMPAVAGIPAESLHNVTLLRYGETESLEWIREHKTEVAAVLVEPVQSRHPGLQPRAFLQELRAITVASGSALIFDEVVTGFRVHPAGVQGLFDIRADMATYGKVIGGGLPIGVLAGNARFMDALDGGAWQFGDASFPGVAPTFVAGTFVRHPLTMAAVCAVLRTIEEHGVALQQSVTDATSSLVTRLNDTLASRGIERRIESFGSFFFLDMSPADRLGNLLHYHLRLRGVYVQEGFPCFLTVAHTPADLGRIVAAFEESLDALQSAGILTVREQHLRLTEQQTEIWLAAQLSDEASCAFNESVSLRLRGTLDRATFARAWDLLVARHEALRASFDATGETMRIAPRVTFTLATTDASATMDPQAAVDAAIAAEARTPFDLARGPLVRGHLLQAGADDHVFVLTAHHIVCDGWSMNVLLREFAAAYGALVGGAMPTLPPPRPFRDYARHESLRTDEERARIESYWQAQFADLPVPLALPTDRPRTELRSFSGGTRTIRIDEATQRAIVAAGAGHGCTLFVTLLAAFTALVGRLADQRDIVVGVPVAGQAELDDAPMVGHCVHMLPIRSRWNDEARLHDLLAITKRAVLGAHDHQGTTLGALVQRIAPQREVGRLPLAEVQFNLERLADSLQLPALHGSVTPNPKAAVAFDLFFNVVEGADGLRIDCDYNAALFDQTTIERWLCCYRGMLDAIVRDADVPVAKAKFLPENEREVLVALQASPVPYPREATVHGLIEARVDEQPDTVAASCGDQGLTYRELDRRANRLAHHLKRVVLKQTGIVAICVDRSLDMLVALLATLKAGFAYLPLDPTHPVARLGFMLEDAGADALVVRDRRLTSQIPYAGTIVALSDDAATIQAAPALRPSHQTCARDRAYVIYTSGSTGKPKGVEVAHQSLVNLLCAMAREPGVTRDDALLAVTTIAFDIAALELFLPLVAGARVAIATSDDALDGFRLAQTLERTGATMLQATPSTWRLLLEADFRPAADFVMLCGGEPLDRALADALLARGGTLWNMYGPTETTIWSSCGRVAATGPITVGRPIANTQFFVLDSADELVPIGTPGHLHIGGDGVAIAYLGRTELTRERFIDNPFGAGRLYRTGDVAVVLPSGEIQLIGRTDRQVKLRGFRIELGEIEELLRQQPGLREAAVELRGAAEGARLVAYYAEREPEAVTVAELERALGSGLPAYMVPTAWVRVAALPRSPNGKLDRGALPQPEETSSGAPGYRPPENRLEEALAQICAEVLQRERVGTMDDLFALGADSIQLFKITARANRQGIGLHAKQLFAHRTIAELATHLS